MVNRDTLNAYLATCDRSDAFRAQLERHEAEIERSLECLERFDGYLTAIDTAPLPDVARIGRRAAAFLRRHAGAIGGAEVDRARQELREALNRRAG